MKNFEITFKNGLLIDLKTQNVLNLNPQAKFTIQGDDADFLLEDYKKLELTPKLSTDKLKDLENRHKKFALEKIADAGDEFCFRIGLGKRTKEDKELEYLFRAIINEDLYLKREHFKPEKKWSFCNCICTCTDLLDGDLGFPFKEVMENSLSALFASVVSSYFNQKRSTACNAFKFFHPIQKGDSISLYELKKYKILNLDGIRNEVIKKYKEKE
jgi:hypothetical protein